MRGHKGGRICLPPSLLLCVNFNYSYWLPPAGVFPCWGVSGGRSAPRWAKPISLRSSRREQARRGLFKTSEAVANVLQCPAHLLWVRGSAV